MKNIIIMIMLLAFSVYSQSTGWSSIKSSGINLTNAISVDIFTNGSGNHIIVQESSSLKYYNIDVNGNTINSVMLENNISVFSPSITGDATRLYVVYRKSNENYIRTNYSSNGGNSWSYLSTNPQNSSANSMESVFSNNKLHITFVVSNNVYHSFYNTVTSSWTSIYQVSTENGYGSRINALHDNDEDKIYVVYKNLSGHIGKWRQYNVATGGWSSIYQAYNISGNVTLSAPTGFKIDESSICIYYFYYAQDQSGTWLYYNTWVVKNRSNGVHISDGGMDIFSPKTIYSTRTADGISHSAFFYTHLLEDVPTIGIWRSNLSSGYPYDLVVGTQSPDPNHINISSASNDVYIIWKEGGSSNLKLRYYDAVPLVPTNISVSASAQYHPVVSWALNNEPDVRVNSQGYLLERRLDVEGSGQWTAWAQIATINGSTSSYEDMGISNASGAGNSKAQYRLRAKDLGGYTSSYSSVVEIHYGTGMEKANGGSVSEVKEYALLQNYPNPFNPTTTISWQSPIDGYTTLKVYDVLGREVTVLVNETMTAGEHSIQFSGSELRSGMYFYKLQVGTYTAQNKMILAK